VQSFNFASATNLAGFEGHYARKTDGALWRLTTNKRRAVAMKTEPAQIVGNIVWVVGVHFGIHNVTVQKS